MWGEKVFDLGTSFRIHVYKHKRPFLVPQQAGVPKMRLFADLVKDICLEHN